MTLLSRAYRQQWSVLVPVRDFRSGKSRLRREISDEVVTLLARHLLLNLLDELLACDEISRILVVSDTDLSREINISGVDHYVQRPGGDLNDAVAEGREYLALLEPTAPVLVMHADLPTAKTSEITHLLHRLDRSARDSYLPDRAGLGTTLLAFLPGSKRMSSFGVGSAWRHDALGFDRISLPRESGLRNDLDTAEDHVRLMGKSRILDSGFMSVSQI